MQIQLQAIHKNPNTGLCQGLFRTQIQAIDDRPYEGELCSQNPLLKPAGFAALRPDPIRQHERNLESLS